MAAGHLGIDVSEMQLEKTDWPSVVSVSGSATEVSFVQYAKAESPMLSMPSGMATLRKDVQL